MSKTFAQRFVRFEQYLALLNPAQEDRVLTGKLASSTTFANEDCSRCLCGHVEDWTYCGGPRDDNAHGLRQIGRFYSIYLDFEQMVDDFGIERMGTAIRNAILSNRARRTLPRDAVPEMEAV